MKEVIERIVEDWKEKKEREREKEERERGKEGREIRAYIEIETLCIQRETPDNVNSYPKRN